MFFVAVYCCGRVTLLLSISLHDGREAHYLRRTAWAFPAQRYDPQPLRPSPPSSPHLPTLRKSRHLSPRASRPHNLPHGDYVSTYYRAFAEYRHCDHVWTAKRDESAVGGAHHVQMPRREGLPKGLRGTCHGEGGGQGRVPAVIYRRVCLSAGPSLQLCIA